jgi:hypothetical protein
MPTVEHTFGKRATVPEKVPVAFGDELPLLDRQWLTRLTNAHNYEVPELWRLLNYYEGQQPLSYMHPELLATLDDRVRQLVINWPRSKS